MDKPLTHLFRTRSENSKNSIFVVPAIDVPPHISTICEPPSRFRGPQKQTGTLSHTLRSFLSLWCYLDEGRRKKVSMCTSAGDGRRAQAWRRRGDARFPLLHAMHVWLREHRNNDLPSLLDVIAWPSLGSRRKQMFLWGHRVRSRRPGVDPSANGDRGGAERGQMGRETNALRPRAVASSPFSRLVACSRKTWGQQQNGSKIKVRFASDENLALCVTRADFGHKLRSVFPPPKGRRLSDMSRSRSQDSTGCVLLYVLQLLLFVPRYLLTKTRVFSVPFSRLCHPSPKPPKK